MTPGPVRGPHPAAVRRAVLLAAATGLVPLTALALPRPAAGASPPTCDPLDRAACLLPWPGPRPVPRLPYRGTALVAMDSGPLRTGPGCGGRPCTIAGWTGP